MQQNQYTDYEGYFIRRKKMNRAEQLRELNEALEHVINNDYSTNAEGIIRRIEQQIKNLQ